MIRNLKDLIAKRKLGPVLVLGLLLEIGIFQISSLVLQSNLNFWNSGVSLGNYFSYLTVAINFIGVTALIWIEIKNLEEFHIDKYALVTLILGSLLRPRIGILGEGCLSGMVILSGIFLTVMWIVKKPMLPRTSRHWTFLGVIAGGVFAILIVLLGFYLRIKSLPSHLLQNNIFPTVLGLIFREFSNGMAFEEIFFRGFVWGYLRKFGWDENKIIWIQGLLFWLLHFGSILGRPFTFFIAIPLGTLVASKLTSYSKQVYPSILSHIIINIVGGLFNLAIY